MKKSINTRLKHSSKDQLNRSANPPVVRASTILFDSMQELAAHEKKIINRKKITHYNYGRYGSQTTIELENIIKDLEEAYHVFLTPTGFGAVSLCLMALCRPGDEVLVSDNVYKPIRELSSNLLPELNVKAIFYDPNDTIHGFTDRTDGGVLAADLVSLLVMDEERPVMFGPKARRAVLFQRAVLNSRRRDQAVRQGPDRAVDSPDEREERAEIGVKAQQSKIRAAYGDSDAA